MEEFGDYLAERRQDPARSPKDLKQDAQELLLRTRRYLSDETVDELLDALKPEPGDDIPYADTETEGTGGVRS
jgi:hypothetical protein